MTPKEKAKELYNKFAIKWHEKTDDVKYYCLTAVDEAILYNPISTEPGEREKQFHNFWQQVKEEIKNL